MRLDRRALRLRPLRVDAPLRHPLLGVGLLGPGNRILGPGNRILGPGIRILGDEVVILGAAVVEHGAEVVGHGGAVVALGGRRPLVQRVAPGPVLHHVAVPVQEQQHVTVGHRLRSSLREAPPSPRTSRPSASKGTACRSSWLTLQYTAGPSPPARRTSWRIRPSRVSTTTWGIGSPPVGSTPVGRGDTTTACSLRHRTKRRAALLGASTGSVSPTTRRSYRFLAEIRT